MTVVAACQLGLVVGEVAANRARARTAIETAASAGAQLIVLPELTPSGYVFSDATEARTLAEPVDGPTITEWRELSHRLGVIVVGGFCELGADGVLYNSAVIIENGALLASYRKAHLWDGETLIFTAGNQPAPVADTAIGRVAVMICYDAEFPEWTRMVGLAGADLLALPTNWPRAVRPDGERPMEVIRVQAAAAGNHLFIVAADRCRVERGVAWVGGSLIVDPDGYPLDGPVVADEQRILYADIDLVAARNKAITAHNDVLADRRAELYDLRQPQTDAVSEAT
jgi:5-aminopentanamidase